MDLALNDVMFTVCNLFHIAIYISWFLLKCLSLLICLFSHFFF